MAYIPKHHEKYNLLPYCNAWGGEVFDYPSRLIEEAEKLLGSSVGLFPYNFDSYEDYFSSIDSLIESNRTHSELTEKLQEVKKMVQLMNQKEEWSVLRYVGPSGDDTLDLTNGKNYYWPTRQGNPVYCGVIDNEEFTSYLYPTDAHLWEILEDPTGMAYNTIYKIGKGKISTEEYEAIIAQFSDVVKNENEM